MVSVNLFLESFCGPPTSKIFVLMPTSSASFFTASAISFLYHPKVGSSKIITRVSFLEIFAQLFNKFFTPFFKFSE